MGHHTRRSSGDATVLMACSICATRCEYPGEIRYCNDKLWRCNKFCTETTNALQQSQIEAASRKRREELAPKVPMNGAWVEDLE